jgi:predicted  nucleic acid-binding Zn-ribbon protein
MNELYSSLLQLQELDQQIAQAEVRVKEFTPRLDELRAPVVALERDAEQARGQLEDLRKQQKKLDHGLNNKRDRLRIFQEKAEKARNVREEAATRTEIDFIARAVEAEEAESNDVNDQVRRQDMKLDDLQKAAGKTKEDLQPRVDEMEAQRDAAIADLKVLQDKRANAALHMDKAAVRLYDRVRSGKRKTALAPLTRDGACGSCYNVLPPQEQSEIRQGASLRRCEACGVILYPATEE